MIENTLNDFFCGCGGLGLGFKQAGFKIMGAWDYDKYAVQSYKANVDSLVVQADIYKMNWSDFPKANVWSFGFPCQDLSIAGNQAGIKLKCVNCGTEFTASVDTEICPNCKSNKFRAANRSGMFFEIMRLLDETRANAPENLPLVLLAENVKRLRPLIPVLEREYKARGYKAYVILYNSKYWGVPQNRERYFIAGIREDIDIKFVFPNEQKAHIPKLSSVLESNVPEKYYLSDEKAKAIIDQALFKLEKLGQLHPVLTPDRLVKRQNGRRAKDNEEDMFTLTAQDLHGVIESITTTTTDEDDCAYCCTSSYHKWAGLSGNLESSRNTQVIEPRINIIGILENTTTHECNNRVYDTNGIAPTATAVCGGSHHIKIFDYLMFRVRKLMPIEYGRLQGFPMDSWQQVVSDNQAYKQFGNAVTVNVAYGIAEYIKTFLLNVSINNKDNNINPKCEDCYCQLCGNLSCQQQCIPDDKFCKATYKSGCLLYIPK